MTNRFNKSSDSTIVYKDIMLRRGVTDKALLERIVKFVLDNISQPISIKKIVDTLNNQNTKTSFYTVESYLTALEECFLIYRADRYDIRGRELSPLKSIKDNYPKYLLSLNEFATHSENGIKIDSLIDWLLEL